MTKWIIREGKAFLQISVYFLFCYGTIIILKKLILEHYDISYFGFGVVILGALISAKAVLIIESTPLGKAFHSGLPFVKVVFDCLLYTGLALILLYVEKVIELGHKEGNYRLAFATVGHNDDLSGFFAMVIWAAISFLGYSVFAAISRHLGPGGLYRLFFTAPRPKSDENSKSP